MKLAFPHAGQAWVPVKTLMDKAGAEVIVPPRCSKRTLTFGARYSPEWMCLPYKVNLGNFIEALEMGADTLVHVSGPGLCRLGNYAKLSEEILHDLGYDFRMILFDWQDNPFSGMMNTIGEMLGPKPMREFIGDVRYMISQLKVLDEIEQRVHYVRPREIERGSITRIWRTVGDRVCAAHTREALKEVREEILAELNGVPQDPNADPLRVGLVGEFFMALEPFCNMDAEEELGKMGVEVTRSAWLSGWTNDWLIMGSLGMSHGQKVKKAAQRYLKRDVSGDAVQSLGETVLHQKEGFDGILHIQPFTCMPEIIAQNIMPAVTKDYDIPVLPVIIDEQMGRAGFITRLEAFVDLMRRRREISRSAGKTSVLETGPRPSGASVVTR